MGGGSKGSGLTADQRNWFERHAKETIEEVDEGIKRNVFISFSSDDLDEVNLLRGQAKNENSNIEFNDYSLKAPFNSKDADYIQTRYSGTDSSKFCYRCLCIRQNGR